LVCYNVFQQNRIVEEQKGAFNNAQSRYDPASLVASLHPGDVLINPFASFQKALAITMRREHEFPFTHLPNHHPCWIFLQNHECHHGVRDIISIKALDAPSSGIL
jgi:hypothetical protein